MEVILRLQADEMIAIYLVCYSNLGYPVYEWLSRAKRHKISPRNCATSYVICVSTNVETSQAIPDEQT